MGTEALVTPCWWVHCPRFAALSTSPATPGRAFPEADGTVDCLPDSLTCELPSY